MSEESPKTPLEHVTATITQLKEMRHYSENNVKLLTTQWLLFDGELSKLGKAASIEAMMMKQSELHDAFDAAIAELDELATTLQPPSEDEASAA